MSSRERKVSKSGFKAFKVITFLAKFLFLPVLAISILILGAFAATTQINNIENGIISSGSDGSDLKLYAGWGYFIAETYNQQDELVKVYAKEYNSYDLEKDDVILFFDVVEKEEDPMVYNVMVSSIYEVIEKDGKVSFAINDSTFNVPQENYIGKLVSSAPSYIDFILIKLNSLTNLIAFGIIPLIIILAVLVLDSVIYLKTKKINVDRGEITTQREEDNVQYFEELKQAYIPQDRKQEQVPDEVKSEKQVKPKIHAAPRPMPPKMASKAPEMPKARPEVHQDLSADDIVKLAKQNEEEYLNERQAKNATLQPKKAPAPPPPPPAPPKTKTPPMPPKKKTPPMPPKKPGNLPPKKG